MKIKINLKDIFFKFPWISAFLLCGLFMFMFLLVVFDRVALTTSIGAFWVSWFYFGLGILFGTGFQRYHDGYKGWIVVFFIGVLVFMVPFSISMPAMWKTVFYFIFTGNLEP